MIKVTLTLLFIAIAFSKNAFAAEEVSSHKEDKHVITESGHTLIANFGVYSNYIFRGLTQTNGKPAIQGGFDYSHSSGIYLGIWGSNVSWLNENVTSTTGPTTTVAGSYDTGGSLELDFYGGYKNTMDDFSYDIGLLQYMYPGTVIGTQIKADTQELYLALGWKWISLKYSSAINSNVFGVKKASGTYYIDLSASIPVGETGLTLGAHYGMQKYTGIDERLTNTTLQNNDNVYSYKDWKVTAAYNMGNLSTTFNNMTVGAAFTGTTDATCQGYGSSAVTCVVNTFSGTGIFPENIAAAQTTIWISKAY